MKTELKIEHIKESLSQDVIIGSAFDTVGTDKRFTFNPWENEYRVFDQGKLIYSGNAIEEMLDLYNSI